MMKQAREEFLALFKTGNYKGYSERDTLGIMNAIQISYSRHKH